MDKSEKKFRKVMKRAYKELSERTNRTCLVDTTASLTEHDVVVVDRGDQESWYHIGIMDPESDTDAEIQEYFDGMVVEIHSAYDCTGRPFTRYIHWHRNPNGMVSYVHAMTLDV